jgi:hypothetical protein
MAKKNPTDIDKFFKIVAKINAGIVPSDQEIEYYYTTAPQIDENLIQEYLAEQKRADADPDNFVADPELLRDGLIESVRKMQSDPSVKERTLKLLQDNESSQISNQLSKGVNLILGGIDIGQSINQINTASQQAKANRRPTRPAIPQRDQLLQQALRSSQEGTFDAARALAPAQADIENQYYNDLANAKIASTGQAGNFGAYAQVASNRRRRAALDLAPIQDQIRAREQERYDNLLGLKMAETQQMFKNQNELYNSDLEQYYNAQDVAGRLGATGRANLRDSMYNFGNQIPQALSDVYTNRKYKRLREEQGLERHAKALGLEPQNIVQARRSLHKYVFPEQPYGATQYYNDPQTVYDAWNKYSTNYTNY